MTARGLLFQTAISAEIAFLCIRSTQLLYSTSFVLYDCVFPQHIPIWILNSATPTILGQITHKPLLPPHLVGFLLFCTAWWEMMTSQGEQRFSSLHCLCYCSCLTLHYWQHGCPHLSLSPPSVWKGASQSFDPPRLHRPGIQHCWRRGWRGNLYLFHPGRRASWPQRRAAQGRPDPQRKNTFIFIKLSHAPSYILQWD